MNLQRAPGFGVVELRRYVMRPGRRDDLVALFEREFIESQGVLMLNAAADETSITAFEREVLPHLARYPRRIAYYVTEPQANDFPLLPLREGEWALVVTGICATVEDLARWTESLEPSRLLAPLRDRLLGVESLRLQPACRSLFA
ncbi:MAG TPA: hypothetical protein VIN40_00675 [Candidatus Tyrphobacter sp.]